MPMPTCSDLQMRGACKGSIYTQQTAEWGMCSRHCHYMMWGVVCACHAQHCTTNSTAVALSPANFVQNHNSICELYRLE